MLRAWSVVDGHGDTGDSVSTTQVLHHSDYTHTSRTNLSIIHYQFHPLSVGFRSIIARLFSKFTSQETGFCFLCIFNALHSFLQRTDFHCCVT